MNTNLGRRLALLFLTLAIFILTAVVAAVSESTIASYELSIFDAYPSYVWVSYIAGFALTVTALVILSCWTGGQRKLTALCVGVLFVYACMLSIFPVLQGYLAVSRGDMLVHAATSAQIINSGAIPAQDFYPSVHLIGAAIPCLSGISVDDAYMMLPIASLIVYSISVYVLIRRLTGSGAIAMIALILSLIPIREGYGVNFHPASLSLSLVPMFLWIYVRSMQRHNLRESLLFVILAVGMIFVHPFTAAILIGGLVILKPLTVLGRLAPLKYMLRGADYFNPTRLVFMSVVLLTWLMGFSIWMLNVNALSAWIGGELKTSIDFIQVLASSAGLSLTDFAVIALKAFGPTYFLLVLSLVWFLVVRSSTRPEDVTLRVKCLPFLGVIILLLFSFLVTLYGPLGLDPLRPVVYMTVLVTIIASIPLGKSLLRRGAKSTCLALVAILLCIPLSVVAVYPSPYTFQPNGQVTPAELSAAGWLASRSQQPSDVVNVWSFEQHTLFIQAIVGNEEPVFAFIPSQNHFGYNQTVSSLAMIYPAGTIVVVTRFDVLTMTELWQNTERFHARDFDNLDADIGLHKVFSNSDVSLWIVSD